jgi:hypothetical protein
MSDCGKCWETPCICGYSYRNYSMERLIEMRDLFQRLIDVRNQRDELSKDSLDERITL